MTNKTLIMIVAVILGLFAGLVFYFRQANQTITGNQISGQDTFQTPGGSINLNGSGTNQATSSQSVLGEQTMGNCVRAFDEHKLSSEKVDIKNKLVEVEVKNFGKITLEFFDQDAPKTVENFLRLTNSGYYDCLTFHRVSRNFVIQGGDPKGDGTGGFSAFGEKFADELNPATDSYKRGYEKGVLAMANSGPNTNGSQFFIMLETKEDLPANYTIFGRVVKGMEVVEKIGQVEITPGMFGPTDGAPKTPIVMEKLTIINK